MKSPCYDAFYIVPIQGRVVAPAFCPADALLDRGGELQGCHLRIILVCKIQEGAPLADVKVAPVHHHLSSSMKSTYQCFFTSSPAPKCVLPGEESAQQYALFA